jgi:succinate dehydrogenase / fumarate reductase cytochrome b subunit
MALSGIFLMFFLLQHLLINFFSVLSPEFFNKASHFMGTNFLVQFILQPILICGVFFHLIMGMYLEYKNSAARPVGYAYNNPSENSTWMSRNMIITGIMIMLFLGLHFYDFWIPEIKYKYIQTNPESPERYFEELQHKFHDLWRVVIYCVSFIFLSLHLLHGFQSSFQSTGFKNNKHADKIQIISNVYAVVVPAGYLFIAMFHYLRHL